MASIAWDDKPATRHTMDEFERGAVKDLGEIAVIGKAVPDSSAGKFSDAIRELTIENEKLLGEQELLKTELASLRELYEKSLAEPKSIEPTGSTPDISPATPDISPATPDISPATPDISPATPDISGPSVDPEPEPEPEPAPKKSEKSEAEYIREYLRANPGASNAQTVDHLATISVDVTNSQVAYQRKRLLEK